MKTRINDKIVTTTEESAIIDYVDILKSCRIESDDETIAPWKNSDGWDHTTTKYRYGPDIDDITNARGYVHRSSRDGGDVLIKLTDKTGQPDYDYFHSQGASKQVSRELAAMAYRRAIDQLTEWYSNGWQWYVAICDYKDHTASMGMIDDEDYARRDIFPELADEIMNRLEEEGYTIENRPAPTPRNEWKKDRIRSNINLFNVSRR